MWQGGERRDLGSSCERSCLGQRHIPHSHPHPRNKMALLKILRDGQGAGSGPHEGSRVGGSKGPSIYAVFRKNYRGSGLTSVTLVMKAKD